MITALKSAVWGLWQEELAPALGCHDPARRHRQGGNFQLPELRGDTELVFRENRPAPKMAFSSAVQL